MLGRTEAVLSLTASHDDEVTDKNVESKQQLDLVLYGDMITKMNCMLDKLNQFTGLVTDSPTVIQNNGAKVEEYGSERTLTSTTDTFSRHTLQITSYLMEPGSKTCSNFIINILSKWYKKFNYCTTFFRSSSILWKTLGKSDAILDPHSRIC